MADAIPEVSDFAGEPGTRTCRHCGAIMDHGELRTDHAVTYAPSRSAGWTNVIDVAAHACISCGHVDLEVDPTELRCMLAGVKLPKQNKPGLL